MFAQVPPEYCVELFTLNTYVPTVKLRFGHDVPETSPPTVIGVVVVTSLSGTICSGVTIDLDIGAVVVATLDGAVGTIARSVPHATSGNAPSAIALNANTVRAFLTIPSPLHRPATRGRQTDRIHEMCHASAVRRESQNRLSVYNLLTFHFNLEV